jgi:putative DNA primase/helicase
MPLIARAEPSISTDVDVDQIPDELKSRRIWTLWRPVLNDKGYFDKVPVNANGDRWAAQTDTACRMSFEAARAAYRRWEGELGLGVAVDGFTAVDLDHAIEGGELRPWARKIVDELGSFTEVSPSGQGVRILIKGRKSTTRCSRNGFEGGGKVELWDGSRFVTLTGNRIAGSDLEERQEQLDALTAELWPEKPQAPPATAPRKGRLIARDTSGSSVEDRARMYLEAMPPAVSGQGGHNQTFDAACALVKGFDLSVGQARPILEEYNLRCVPPWSDRELSHKLESADAKPDDRPRGYLRDAQVEGGGRPPAGPELAVGLSPEGLPEKLDDPHRLARTFVDRFHRHPDGLTIREWKGDTWAWSNRHAWQPVEEAELGALLNAHAKTEFDSHAREHGEPPKAVGSRLIGDVKGALKAQTLLRSCDVPSMPAWLSGEPRPDPKHAIVTQSGILDLRKLADGVEPFELPITPAFFSPAITSYAFDPDPPEPTAWLEFLQDLWGDDPESIAALQEWFGYLLTGDTSRQKILAIIGPRRSGKGTIARTLQALVGDANVAAPTLNSLCGPFGIQPLIGKSIALISEARLSGKADSQAVVERLLSISGQDPQTLDRKHKTAWTGQLGTRFVLMANQTPGITDASSALAGRLVLLKLSRSYFGREDLKLGDRIAAELPGILLWAIEGWRRLHGQAQFTQPASGLEELRQFEEEANPVGAFVAQCCVEGPDESAPVGDVYEAWKTWCETNGRDRVGNVASFGKAIRTSLPKVSTDQQRDGRVHVRFFRGISLKEEAF